METNIGFETQRLTDTSALAFQVTARPQRLVRPKKLVVIVNRTGTTIVPAILIASVFVGPINQLSSADPLPAEAFTADNTHYLMGTSAAPGTDIIINILATANTAATEYVDITCMLNCDAIG
jgi:hypothetical protein